jgi:hypothetical protein
VNIAWPIWFFVVGIAASIGALVAKRSSALTQRLSELAISFGWAGLRRIWWNGAWRGQWRGFDVQLRHNGRHKNIPEHIVLTVSAASPARVMVKRRCGFLSKPLTLFGPPMVEPMNFPNREQFWIRSDETAFVERLFSNAEMTAEIERNLIAGFDVVDLQPKGVRIVRSLDEGAVKKQFGRNGIRFRADLELIDEIAAEEWKLAVMIIETLGLRGYE